MKQGGKKRRLTSKINPSQVLPLFWNSHTNLSVLLYKKNFQSTTNKNNSLKQPLHQSYALIPRHLALVSIQTHACIPCMKVCLVVSVPCAQVLVLLLAHHPTGPGSVGEKKQNMLRDLGKDLKMVEENDASKPWWIQKFRTSIHWIPDWFAISLAIQSTSKEKKRGGKKLSTVAWKFGQRPKGFMSCFSLITHVSQVVLCVVKNKTPPVTPPVLHVLLKFGHGWIFRWPRKLVEYAREIGTFSPQKRSKNKKYLSCHHL